MNSYSIIRNERLSDKDYILSVKAKSVNIKPGQFAMLSVRQKESLDPLLRRPLAIFDVEGDEVSFLYRGNGRGIELLHSISDSISILMPLGNPVPDNFDRYLFIAGGVGIAGVFLAAKTFNKDRDVHVLYGEKDKSSLSGLPFLKNCSLSFSVYTENGSFGKKGFVTQDLESFRDYTWVACGPMPMLKGVKLASTNLGAKCFLMLNARMACGVGACLGCAVKTIHGYKRCCKEGPVFDAQEVVI